jgi:hypothetical protein
MRILTEKINKHTGFILVDYMGTMRHLRVDHSPTKDTFLTMTEMAGL